jgi:hypothetical protein
MRKATYIWPYLGKHEMNRPADDIVSPSLVIVAVRFLSEGSYAFPGAVPLSIWSCAPLLGAAAQLFD